MLDVPDSPQSAAANDLPTPPSGRRAASRPAGPPKPVETTPTPPPAPELPATPEQLGEDAEERPEGKAELPDGAELLDEAAEPDPADMRAERTDVRAERTGGTADGSAEDSSNVSEDSSEAVADDAAAAAEEPGQVTATAAGASGEAGESPDDFESELQARIEAQLAPRVSGDPTELQVAAETPRTGRTLRAAGETADAKPNRRRTRKSSQSPEVPETFEVSEISAVPGELRAVADVESGAVSTLPDARTEEPQSTGETSAAPAEPAGDDAATVEAETTGVESTEAKTPQTAKDGAHSGGKSQDADTDTSDTGENQNAADQNAEDQNAEDQGTEDHGDDSSDSGTRRRRRRRGGRRRRRSGSNGSAEQSGDDNDGSDDADGDSGTDDDSGGGDSGNGDSGGDDSGNGDSDSDDSTGTAEGRRRRRRRRRRGEDTGGADDPDTDVIVKVREPRRTKAADEVTGIEGSTRLEAKRQRRREGRAAGRRRTPILSEAEFLARRESVERTMVIRQKEDLAQIAVLEDNVLVEHYVDRASASSLIGNVYLGRVQNVLPSMEAAFVDIGRGRNAVLYAGELDWDSFGAEGQTRKVEKVLKSGQTVLVQVTKDPVGAKGARLTNHISLPGRYIVYSPGGHLSGISRKLPDTERKRLKEILGELIGDDASVIVRTAAEGSSEEELVRDVNRLKAQWESIEKKVKAGQAPQQLYAEPDATVRIVRDLFTEDFSKLVIDGNGGADDAYDTITAYVSHVAPHLSERIERWRGDRGDILAAHRVDEQIAKALERKVFLPSGGSLIIDRTEAMTVIDVNTGKFTGSGGNLEATVTSNNLEAAEEVVRQLRLRDIGGIIVVDFIDMVLPSNRELLLRRLVECLGRDRTRHQVAEVTSLGLVQMTRKKIGTGLAEAFTETCECCKGRGYQIHDLPVESQSQADGGDRGRRGRGRTGNGNANNKPDASRSDRRRSRGSDETQADVDTSGETEVPAATAEPAIDQTTATRDRTATAGDADESHAAGS